jgi:hypothetical protein
VLGRRATAAPFTRIVPRREEPDTSVGDLFSPWGDGGREAAG